MSSQSDRLTDKQRKVLLSVAGAGPGPVPEYDAYVYGRQQGWWGNGLDAPSSPLFGHLKKLADRGYLTRSKPISVYRYELTSKAREALA